MLELIKHFLGGLIQVILVTVNTFQIAIYAKTGTWIALILIPIGVVGFLISFLWTFNVKGVMGGMKDRVAYAGGAASGSVLGPIIGHALNMLL